MKKRQQCKDIDDRMILSFLAQCPKTPHTWFDGEVSMRSVVEVMPGIPQRLVLAKMNMLIRRGLVGGCACGCRGDFMITKKGLDHLKHNPA